MKFRRLKYKPVPWKAVSHVTILTILLSLLRFVNPAAASVDSGSAGVPADTLTIKVGYFGGPYYIKKIFSASDLEAMPQVEQAYTFIDNMPSVVIDSAIGVKLTDLLAGTGIDVNSVQSFYFYATDFTNGWYVCLTKSYLLETPRYYYPNLPAFWDANKQTTIPGAVYGAIQVPTILATRDNWQRFATAPDFNVRDTSARFRLLFGQTDTSTQTAVRSAKWVHAIEVMLDGAPPSGVTLDQNLANLKVGSTVQLKATVAPENATDKSVVWSSSDTRVATVDDNGLVTIVGPGTSTITVRTVVGNMAATCIVNDPDRGGVGQGAVTGGASSKEDGARKDPAGLKLQEADLRYLPERDLEEAGAVTAKSSPKQPGRQPWRVFEMSPDATPLHIREEQGNLDLYAALIFLGLILLGAGKRYAEYVKEI